MFAGGADVGEKFTQARDTDPKLELLRPVLELWLPCLGSDPVTTRELIRRTESTDFLSSDGAAFVQSLRTLAGMRRTDAFDAHRLGGLLAKNHGKIVGGLRLERSQHRQNHAQWTVVQV